MSVSKASLERYSDPTFVGAYLEAEWGDRLKAFLPPTPSAKFNEPCFSEFYGEVAEFALDTIGTQIIETVCDIGCSTGRLIYELCQRFSAITDIVGVEPSPVFTDYARKFLLKAKTDQSDWIPIPDTQLKPTYIKLNEEFFNSVAIEEDRRTVVDIFTGLGEDTPRPEKYFDVLFCLNVVDRHPNPEALVKRLGRLLKHKGSFFLASPMDWDKRFTAREYWTDDLTQLFPEGEWEKRKETDLLYPFRYAMRHKTNYVSQVVCMKRR